MKILASVTILMAIPTVIGGLFGMNFQRMPLINNEYGFEITMIITMILTFSAAYLLYKKDMFSLFLFYLYKSVIIHDLF